MCYENQVILPLHNIHLLLSFESLKNDFIYIYYIVCGILYNKYNVFHSISIDCKHIIDIFSTELIRNALNITNNTHNKPNLSLARPRI